MKKICYTFLLGLIVLSACENNTALKDVPDDVSYVIDSVVMPEGLDPQVGALEFLPDGRLVAGFLRGEIMIYNPETTQWSLFAEGLHEPLGIHVVSASELLVMQRPELTRLRDTDGDGQADVYETLTDDFGLTGNYHEFNYGPVLDKQGNIFIGLNSASSGGTNIEHIRGTLDTTTMNHKGQMYSAVPYRGWIMKLGGGGVLEPFACGLRSPNGMGFDDEGNLFVTENQGDWVGTSALYHIEKGNFYGHPSSLVWKDSWDGSDPLLLPVETLDSMRTKAAVLFPHGIMANSPTQPLLDRSGGDFGPFSHQMFVGEMNSGRIVRVMLEEVGGALQGACVYFIDGGDLRKGNNRIAFAPDGSLWVGQAEYGWAGAKGIQRIRYTGNLPMDIAEMKLTADGFHLSFTQAAEKSSIVPAAHYKVRRYRYAYHKKYGSPQMDLQEVKVSAVNISEDGKQVFLELESLEPGFVYELTLEDVVSSSGIPLKNNLICYTLNQLLPGAPENTGTR